MHEACFYLGKLAICYSYAKYSETKKELYRVNDE